MVASGGDKLEGGSSAPDANAPTMLHRPEDWSDIKVWSLVLANEGNNEGWWKCAVTGIKEGEYALRWLHYPEEPPFIRRREQLGCSGPHPLSLPATDVMGRSSTGPFSFGRNQMIDTIQSAEIAAATRALNDQLRKTGTSGRTVLVPRRCCPADGRPRAGSSQRRRLRCLTAANNPYAERDCGIVDAAGNQMMWKIDYHSSDLDHTVRLTDDRFRGRGAVWRVWRRRRAEWSWRPELPL